jgi:CheY-like chemotaxis protein
MGDNSWGALVVDDDEMICRATQRMFHHLGLDCDIARDGDAAVAAARASRYSVILMDVNMPGLDGPGATRAILTGFAAKPPVIIGMTGGVDEKHHAECLLAGMSTVLTKPVRLEDVSRLVALSRTVQA